MGEFFRGWRRKLGVLTLMLACVFMVGWVRSLAEFDVLIRLNEHNTHIVISAEGTLSWEIMWPIVEPRPSRWMYRPQPRNQHDDIEVPLGFHGLGFDFRDQSKIETRAGTAPYIAESQTWQIPYWSVVIPLTLLSAYLLLSKPRNSTPMKTTELVSEKAS